MANIKPEGADADADDSMWQQGYSLQSATSIPSHIPYYDSNYQAPSLSTPYHGRPQRSSYRSLDLTSLQTRPATQNETGPLTASPPTLNSPHSYPSLKRPFQAGNQVQYMENAKDFRNEMPEMHKPAISQDHRMLNFKRLPNDHTIIDDQGRPKKVELAAQLHGMFFLSELATPSGHSLLAQPELTCYRRNLFQISGNATSPRGPLSWLSERGERIQIFSMEICVSASESVDGHVVKLIVIPWKTPPPNSPEVAPGQEQEPLPIPLVAIDGGAGLANDFTVFPINYRRLQFRIATANNGRRRELQQRFTLHLNVVGTLANGAKVNVCETSTAPIVVRGRSPRNFQTRKEIPLLGSSSSRGHPPELYLATATFPNPTLTPRRATMPKLGTVELPRSPFTFDSSSISGSPSMARQLTYPTWNAGQTPEQSTASTSPNYPAPVLSLENYLQTNQKTSALSSPSLIPPLVAMGAPLLSPRHHYPYQSPSPPTGPPLRFIDSNPRPTKSPRHVAPPDLPSNMYSDYAARFALPYSGNAASMATRTGEYFPTTLPIHAWTTGPDPDAGYTTVVTQALNVQNYEYPGETYVKEEPNQQPHYTWNQS